MDKLDFFKKKILQKLIGFIAYFIFLGIITIRDDNYQPNP